MLIFFKTLHNYYVFHFFPLLLQFNTTMWGILCLQITVHTYSISISGAAPRGISGFETAQSDP